MEMEEKVEEEELVEDLVDEEEEVGDKGRGEEERMEGWGDAVVEELENCDEAKIGKTNSTGKNGIPNIPIAS